MFHYHYPLLVRMGEEGAGSKDKCHLTPTEAPGRTGNRGAVGGQHVGGGRGLGKFQEIDL